MAKRLKYKYHNSHTYPDLATNHILVFPSNEAGLHSKGIPLIANCIFGAEFGVGLGVTGRCYAVPVRDRFIRPLSVNEIKRYVGMLKEYTHNRPDLRFWIMDIGTDKKEYKPHAIAPLFKGCNTNCNFPINWKPYLK